VIHGAINLARLDTEFVDRPGERLADFSARRELGVLQGIQPVSRIRHAGELPPQPAGSDNCVPK